PASAIVAWKAARIASGRYSSTTEWYTTVTTPVRGAASWAGSQSVTAAGVTVAGTRSASASAPRRRRKRVGWSAHTDASSVTRWSPRRGSSGRGSQPSRDATVTVASTNGGASDQWPVRSTGLSAGPPETPPPPKREWAQRRVSPALG